jgi:hypothetical protein
LGIKHWTKGYFLRKQQVDSPHSYETCMFYRTDRWTNRWTDAGGFCTSTCGLEPGLPTRDPLR